MSPTVNTITNNGLRFKPIEVLVIGVILGILTLGAIPSFRAYLLSAVVEDAVNFGEDEAIKITDFFRSQGHLPKDIGEAKLANFEHIDRLRTVIWLDEVPAGFSAIETDSEHTEGAFGTENKKTIGALSFEIDVTNLDVEAEASSAWFLLLAQQKEEGNLTWKCVAAKDPLQGLENKYLPRRCID